MYDVLLAIDRDEDRARAQARTVADMPLDGARVTLLHVFEENPSGASVNQVAAVRRAEEILEETDVEIRYDETSGHPATEIVDVATEGDYDLVVLAGRNRSATGKLLFGSTTQEVLLDLHLPVLVCRAVGSEA